MREIPVVPTLRRFGTFARLRQTGEFRVETVWLDKAKTTAFRGVPQKVWNFHIGGYQVYEKWLKDRQAKGGKTRGPAAC